MKQIDTLFDQMDAWRHLPNYQLERRADLRRRVDRLEKDPAPEPQTGCPVETSRSAKNCCLNSANTHRRVPCFVRHANYGFEIADAHVGTAVGIAQQPAVGT